MVLAVLVLNVLRALVVYVRSGLVRHVQHLLHRYFQLVCTISTFSTFSTVPVASAA